MKNNKAEKYVGVFEDGQKISEMINKIEYNKEMSQAQVQGEREILSRQNNAQGLRGEPASSIRDASRGQCSWRGRGAVSMEMNAGS